MKQTPGSRFREAVEVHRPLQIVGAINALTAKLAERTGFHAIYLSGAGVANASFGLPDLGITTLNDVLEDARRITAATSLPLLVDIDTGFGSAFSIAKTIREMVRAGVAAIHMEDQVQAKRCGHRPNKQIVSTTEMCDRIKAAVDARNDDSFVIMARSDAHASEGLQATIDRANAYVAAGADMIFAEALQSQDEFQTFTKSVPVPILANMTEFGKTKLLSTEEFGALGIAMVLYPLSAFRAMMKAAENVYSAIHREGTQASVIELMQTRTELYDLLGYHEYEATLDRLFAHQADNE